MPKLHEAPSQLLTQNHLNGNRQLLGGGIPGVVHLIMAPLA